VDALRRARALGRQLAPTQALNLQVSFRPGWVSAVGRRSAEWLVFSNEESGASKFSVSFNAETEAIQKLAWAGTDQAPERSDRLSTERDILDRDRAVRTARGYLHLLGLRNVSGPWTVDFCRPAFATPPAVGRVWCLHIRSHQWSVYAMLDAATAELSRILIFPVGRCRY
jgi:hypothetical protein